MEADLKSYAKNIYFNDVKIKNARIEFEKNLNRLELIDKRKLGFYCSQCGKISKTAIAFVEKNKVIYSKMKESILIVNKHYDGCRGWN
jgi:hypothetical protein